MSISINWESKIIYVAKVDTTLIQSSPSEIRELDIMWFRAQLKGMESSVDGMLYDDIHVYRSEVTLGDLTFDMSLCALSCQTMLRIISGFTVTFEDGNYTINVVNGYSNITEVVNGNNVVVHAQPLSSANISFPSMEALEYDNKVCVDINSNNYGVYYPVGTMRSPCSSISDAVAIAEGRNFKKLLMLGAVNINNIDLSSYIIKGYSKFRSSVYIGNEANTCDCEFRNITVSGTMGNRSIIDGCVVGNIRYSGNIIRNSFLNNTVTLCSGVTVDVIDCRNISYYDGAFNIDMGISGNNINVRNFTGDIVISNMSGSDNYVIVDVNVGNIVIDESVTNGRVILRGIGTVEDNSTGNAVVIKDSLISSSVSQAMETVVSNINSTVSDISSKVDEVYIKLPSGNIASQSEYTDILLRALGLLQENQYIDRTQYDDYVGQKLLVSARLRTYSNADSVGSDNDVSATYNITSTWSNDEMRTYKVVRE